MDLRYLRASNGNGEAGRATITNDRNPAAPLLEVDNVINWPTHFIAMSGTPMSSGYLDPGTVMVFRGHLDDSDIIIDQIAPGYTDLGNIENQVVLIRPSTDWTNFVADALDFMDTNIGGHKIVISESQPDPDPLRDIIWFEPL